MDHDGQVSFQDALGAKVHSFADVKKFGLEHPIEHENTSKPDDIAVINYTSGTTGNPKGVMLTHANFLSAAAGIQYGQPIDHNSCWYSYLPLPHVYERCIQVQSMMFGERIGFVKDGDVKNMVPDLQALKPTRFGGVPRVWNRFYDKVMAAKAMPGFEQALEMKVKMVKSGVITKDSELDKKVFNKFQAVLGGKVCRASIGAAPVSAEVLNVLRAAFGCEITEGYGQTECLLASATNVGDFDGGIGPPAACNEIRLEDVPEMNLEIRERFWCAGQM